MLSTAVLLAVAVTATAVLLAVAVTAPSVLQAVAIVTIKLAVGTAKYFKSSEICIPATAFVILINIAIFASSQYLNSIASCQLQIEILFSNYQLDWKLALKLLLAFWNSANFISNQLSAFLKNAIFVLNWQLNQQLATQKLSCQLSIRLLISKRQMNRQLAIFIVKQCKYYFKSKFNLLEQYKLCF